VDFQLPEAAGEYEVVLRDAEGSAQRVGRFTVKPGTEKGLTLSPSEGVAGQPCQVTIRGQAPLQFRSGWLVQGAKEIEGTLHYDDEQQLRVDFRLPEEGGEYAVVLRDAQGNTRKVGPFTVMLTENREREGTRDPGTAPLVTVRGPGGSPAGRPPEGQAKAAEEEKVGGGPKEGPGELTPALDFLTYNSGIAGHNAGGSKALSGQNFCADCRVQLWIGKQEAEVLQTEYEDTTSLWVHFRVPLLAKGKYRVEAEVTCQGRSSGRREVHREFGVR
jgi:hypothetical protein